VLALKAANQMDEAEVFGELARVGLVEELDELIKSVNFMKRNFGDEAGDARAMLSKAFAAGGPSTFEAIQIFNEAASISSSAQKVGVSDEELLAAMTVLAESTTSPETAGTAIKNLTDKAAKLGMRSTGLRDLIGQFERDMAGQGLSSAQFLNDAQAIQGFDLITRDWKQIASLTKDIMAANSGQMLDEKIRLMEGAEAATIRRREAAGELEASKIRKGMGEDEQLRRTITDVEERVRVEEGWGRFMLSVFRGRRRLQNTLSLFGPEAVTTQQGEEMLQRAERSENPELLEAVRELVSLQRMANARDEKNDKDPSKRTQPARRTPRPETN
jgi:hypothetical protein